MKDAAKTGHQGERAEEIAQFFANAPLYRFLLLDASLNIVAGNDLVLELFSTFFHMKKEEIIGKSFPELVPGFESSDRHRRYLEVLRTGEPFYTEEVLAPTVAGSAQLSVMVFKAGDCLGIIATDITERKRLEAALRESEQKYSTLVEKANDGVVILQDEALVFINQTMADISGYSVEEMSFRHFLDFVTPESRATVNERYRLRMAGKAVLPYELKIVCRDGTIKDVETSASLIQFQGRPASIAIVRDITERKRALEAIRESESRYRTFFDGSPTALWEIDASYMKQYVDRLRGSGVTDFRQYFNDHPEEARECERRVKTIEVNRASLELFEAASREELMAGLSRVLPRDTTPPYSGGIVAIAEGRTSFEREVVSRTLSGKQKHFFYRWSVLPGHEDTFSRLLVSMVDITDRVRLEQEIQRTQKLDSLGVLAGGIAHDFNNFLTAISTNISMARMYGNLQEDISEMLRDAEKASSRAKNLTEQLLTFAKGGKPIRRTVSLPELFRDAAEFALSGSNVRSEYSFPPGLWPVLVDEGQIGQVVNNLVINADQAMPGGGSIEIAAENVLVKGEDPLPLNEGRYVRVSVKDHGVGISKKHLGRVFDPFFTTKQKGSGLGLTTCFTILKNHGGHVRIHSQVDVGTTVEVFLPASEEASAVDGAEEAGPILGEGRVLVIDDEEMIRRSASEMLRRFGYEAEVAEDGTEGIRRYREALKKGLPFDAVIMDLTIRGGDGGKEAVRELLEIDPDAKVVVSSGYSDDPVMSNFEEHGFREVITKPYRIEEVGRILQKVIAGGD